MPGASLPFGQTLGNRPGLLAGLVCPLKALAESTERGGRAAVGGIEHAVDQHRKQFGDVLLVGRVDRLEHEFLMFHCSSPFLSRVLIPRMSPNEPVSARCRTSLSRSCTDIEN